MAEHEEPPLRQVQCGQCGGEGRWFVPTGYDPRDGSQTGYEAICSVCNGDGWYVEEVAPDEEDLIECFFADDGDSRPL